MLYELRHYTTPDTTSLSALTSVFGEHILPVAETHGMRVVGSWTVAIGQQPRFTVMLAFDDANQRQEQFASFLGSDAWRQAEPLLFPNGAALITGLDTALLRPTDYSPDSFRFMDAASPGVFEERIYRARNERTFAGVNRRFNDHTVRIFAKHGIVPVGFWTVDVGADQMLSLYYLLRFDSLGDYNPKWNAFRSDPEWQQVREDSERDGNLLLWIRSTILAPTPFSPMR